MEVYDIKVTERTDKKSGGTSGSKIYEFPFIPRSYGDFVLDPIQYSYYDINTGKYVVLSTPAISYHVYKSKDSIVPEEVSCLHGPTGPVSKALMRI